MEKVVIVFCICSLVNVILSTLKTLIMVNAGEKMSIFINAVCYGFYTLVVKQLGAVDYVTAVVVTILANIVGVWVSYRIMNLFKKDKLWKVEVTVPISEGLSLMKDIRNAEIAFNYIDIRKYYLFNFYCNSQEESLKLKEILKKYRAKYFVSETKSL